MHQHSAAKWTSDRHVPPSERADVLPAHIVLAEDDADLRHLLARCLRDEGYAVTEAADGEQLLDFVASRQSDGLRTADLIVTDIRMPGPSGLWVLATLRHIDWVTPFVVITAYPDQATVAQARRLGAAAVLRKPIELDEFRAAVDSIVGLPAA